MSTSIHLIRCCVLTIKVDTWNETRSSLQCVFLSPLIIIDIDRTHSTSILSVIHQRWPTRIKQPHILERPLYQPDRVLISETTSHRRLSDEVSLQDRGPRTPKLHLISISVGNDSFGRFDPPITSGIYWARRIRSRSNGAGC